MNNNIKTALQKREFSSLCNESRVILQWATGCGKSKMVIDLINYHTSILNSGIPKRRILFVVAERAHIKNWEEEWRKWKLNSKNLQVRRVCYASLHKVCDESWDIVVLDEGHHCFTEKRLAALESLKKNMTPDAHVYLLSATLSSSKIKEAEEILGKFKVSCITLKDAILANILPDPKVYVIKMSLDNNIADCTIRLNNPDSKSPVVSWEDRNKYIFSKKPCILKCTQFQKYVYYTNLMEYWKQRYENSHSMFQHNMWVNAGSQRKRFLGESKLKVVKNLLDSFPKSRRYVCFCASVDQANCLSEKHTISSKRSSWKNQTIIDAFNNKSINSLFAVGMITEGMNLNDIQAGVIVQLDGKERLFVQKFGRSMRADSPVSFIFYYENTQDEVYLKNALENIDFKYISHISINQLKTIKL